MLDLVIRGGQVVTPQGVGAWDIGVEGERIGAVAAPGTPPRDVARFVDATGKLVIPGGIDPHVHTHWPIPALGGGHTTSAPPEQVSRAAGAPFRVLGAANVPGLPHLRTAAPGRPIRPWLTAICSGASSSSV